MAEDAVIPELGNIVASKTDRESCETAATLCDLTGTGIRGTATATPAQGELKRPGPACLSTVERGSI